MADKNYILTIDQSTSASKVMLFNENAMPVHRVSLPHKQYYPAPGFVEHDPEEISSNVLEGIKRVVNETALHPSHIKALAITNQRETSLIWDKLSGKPLHNAAVWQCQRGREWCNQIIEMGLQQSIKEKTGLIPDTYFSAGKLHWLMNNIAGAKQKAQRGDLAVGTIDSWLIWKLTGGKVHATDFSNASRTMLFNINSLTWDEELLKLADLHSSMMPDVMFSDKIFGYTEPDATLGVSIPISGVMGDSHAALFGQACFHPGMAKATYGTGSSIMLNIGYKPLEAPPGLVTSIGFARDGKVIYVFEGNIHSTGDTIKWLKDELQLISAVEEAEQLALSVSDNQGVYLVPAFAGLGAPYWDNQARAAIVGLSRNSGRAHIARAALESIAYQVKDLTDAMKGNASITLTELRVDGGPTRNNLLMQFQADVAGIPINRSNIEEISALGATFMAGLAAGIWMNMDEIESLRNSDRVFEPNNEPGIMKQYYAGWQKAVSQVRFK